MQKKILALCTVLLAMAMLVCGAYAAEGKTVYVSHSAAAGGDGTTADTAFNTLSGAVAALNGEGGTLVFCGNLNAWTNFTIPEQASDLTLTSINGARLSLTGTINLAKNTNDNTVTFDLPIDAGANGIIFGGFNSVHFTANAAGTGTLAFYGGIDAPEAENGYTTNIQDIFLPENKNHVTDLPYSITVDGGNFGVFMGGNRRSDTRDYNRYIGAIAAPLTVTINGGTFTSPVTYTADAALKLDPAFCLSGQSFLSDDATLTVNGGTFDTPIYVHGYIGQTGTRASVASAAVHAEQKYYVADGDVSVTINGGTFNGCEISIAQTAATYNRLHRGDFSLIIADSAVLADGMVVDATQVKAYSDKTATASLTTNKDVTVKRFDIVNGESKTYDEPLRIACIGDSITQGTGAGVYETKAYPAQLYTQAVAAKKDVIISNYGCGATKVLNYGGLWYNDGLAYTLSMEETDADYIIVGLGTNDSGSVPTAVGQKDHFYNAYTDLILGYEALPDTDKVFGTSAIFRNAADLGALVVRALQEKVLTEQKTAGKKVQYVDLYALTLDKALTGEDKTDNELLASDLLHPHASGYTYYADKIYNAVFNGVYEVADFEMTDIWVAPEKPAPAEGEEETATAQEDTTVYGHKNNPGTKEAPTSNIAVAFAKAAPNATIHIIGTYEYTKLSKYVAFNTPLGVEKLTITGDGDGAVLSMNTKLLSLNSDVTLDNITVRYSGADALYIAGNYNNITFTETAKTLGKVNAIFTAGYWVFADDITNASLYNSVESVSTDKDCTVTLNGGTFRYFNGGNLHWPGNKGSIYGTYSGNMTINIGEKVVISNFDTLNGINGMNYLTGTITANINSWPEGASIRDYAQIGTDSEHIKTYDERNNTGTVTINKGADVTGRVIITGDFDTDGDIDLADTLALLKKILMEGDSFDKELFYGQTPNLVNVLRALKKLVA